MLGMRHNPGLPGCPSNAFCCDKICQPGQEHMLDWNVIVSLSWLAFNMPGLSLPAVALMPINASAEASGESAQIYVWMSHCWQPVMVRCRLWVLEIVTEVGTGSAHTIEVGQLFLITYRIHSGGSVKIVASRISTGKLLFFLCNK